MKTELRTVSFDHPDALKLSDRVQRDYEQWLAGGDETPLDPAVFVPPRGICLVCYDERDTPVATGSWRSQNTNDEGYADGDAEIKRMYVVPEARGRGLARLVLAALENDARAAGRTRMVLETAVQLPEAISLYVSSAYRPCAKFGFYRSEEFSRCYEKTL
jgi:ribosomal protein S18 acetylase RimI-like enzyme